VNGDGVDVLIEDHRRCEALFQAVGDQSIPKTAAVDDIIRLLSIHDALESEYLYPLVETRLPNGNQLATTNIGDHVEIAGWLAEIDRRKPGDSYRADLLGKVIRTVRAHIVEEERTLFPQLRQHLAPEELARFGDDLRAARHKVPTRPHPHAPRFSVGTRFAAAVLRPVDRLRDAVRRKP
jgi:hemerythrin superfamily protein